MMSASLRPDKLSIAMMAPFGQKVILGTAFDLFLDAGEPEQLQGPQMKMRGARQRRAATQPLDDK